MLLVANKMMQKNRNMNKSLAHGYSFENTQQVQHDFVYRWLKKIFSLTLMPLVANLAVTK